MRAASTDPTTVLAIEEIAVTPSDQVVILHSTDPALALSFGKTAAHTAVYDFSLTTLTRIHQQASARKVPNLTLYEEVFPEGERRFDIAVMTVPKGRDYSRGLMYAARKTLKPGGRLYLVGPTEGGAKSAILDMGVMFGSSATLAYRKRNRIGVSVQPESMASYPADWDIDPTGMVQKEIGGRTLYTMPGVFSWTQLDDGSAKLLDNVSEVEGKTVLDLGCGNGVLGLAMAARGASLVTLSDDNLLAIRCARANAAQVENVEVVPSDVYAGLEGRTFDLIISNPPFHQKFDVDTNVAHRIMREAINYLTPGGRLIIVANAFLKYSEVMIEHLERVRTLSEDKRYIVIEGRRPEKGAVKPAGVRGSKRRSELDEAELFRATGELPPVREVSGEEAAAEDDELAALFAELEAAKPGGKPTPKVAGKVAPKPVVTAPLDLDDDEDNDDFDGDDFDDEDDDFDDDVDDDDFDFEEPQKGNTQ